MSEPAFLTEPPHAVESEPTEQVFELIALTADELAAECDRAAGAAWKQARKKYQALEARRTAEWTAKLAKLEQLADARAATEQRQADRLARLEQLAELWVPNNQQKAVR